MTFKLKVKSEKDDCYAEGSKGKGYIQGSRKRLWRDYLIIIIIMQMDIKRNELFKL